MKKVIVLALVFAMSACLFGCYTEKPPNYNAVTEDGKIIYSTENSIDPMNYALYVNERINIVLNVLEGHMANGTNVAKGNYPASDELDNVKESLDSVSEAITFVESLNPPNDYEDERDYVLRRMTNVENTLETYKEDLENDDLNHIEDYVNIMSGDFTALKSAFNNPIE